jgi:hypothetical protein
VSGRDPVYTLAWVCIGLGLAIVVLGSGYVILENRALGTPPRTTWTPPMERDDELPVWPFLYSGTAVVAYGVLLLIIDRR